MCMEAILGQRTMTILAIFRSPHPKEAPHEIWAKLAQRLQRRSHLKMLMDGGKVITIAHPEQRSGELKKKSPTPLAAMVFDVSWRLEQSW